MTSRRCLRLLLVCTVAAGADTALAAPEDCLTLRDNVAVAGCANKYSRGTPAATALSPAAPSPKPTARTAHQPIEAAEKWLLFPVPTAVVHKSAPAPETPQAFYERDRSELIRRAEMGAIGLAAVGLIFGIWRWRASMVKTCSFCGARIAPGASVCKRCFRST